MLHVHRAERADALVDALGEMLGAPPDDPFAAEVVAGRERASDREDLKIPTRSDLEDHKRAFRA